MSSGRFKISRVTEITNIFNLVLCTKNEVKRQQFNIPDLMGDLCSLLTMQDAIINLQNAAKVRLPNPEIV